MKFQNIKLYNLKDYLEIQTLKQVREKINKKNTNMEKSEIKQTIKEALHEVLDERQIYCQQSKIVMYALIAIILALLFVFIFFIFALTMAQPYLK